MTLTRRSFIQSTTVVGAVGATVASPMVAEAAASEPYDPLLEAINAYYAGWQAFLDAPEDEASDHMHLWQVPNNVLREWEGGCTSAEGAKAALSLAIEVYEIGDTPLIPAMMRAALSYLEGDHS